MGILREKFPKKLSGTVGIDMAKLKKTLGYNDDPSFGFCEAMIGRLGMKDEEVETNFTSLLESLKESGPKKAGNFILKAELFVDSKLKSTFSVHHDLIGDKCYLEHLKSAQSQ